MMLFDNPFLFTILLWTFPHIINYSGTVIFLNSYPVSQHIDVPCFI